MEPHERLDHALNERRIELRMEWNEVAEEIGMSTRALLDIRNGRSRPRELRARAMDDWLGWEAGSVQRLLASGEPTPTAAPPASEGAVPEGSTTSQILDRNEQLLRELESRLRGSSTAELEDYLDLLTIMQKRTRDRGGDAGRS